MISAITNNQFWWHLSRASGIVAWVLVSAATAWGILLSTRLLKPYDRPAWLLDLHRWLGWLSVTTIGIHIASLVADTYDPQWGWSETLIPMNTSWNPGATAWGILAMYIVAIVQLSSVVMKRIPKSLWRSIHMTSYVACIMTTVHAVTAGTDRSNHLFGALAVALSVILVALFGIRILYAGKPKTREVIRRSETVNSPSTQTTEA
jgi:methionine sulfoxide reductase heme-binding subunit